jgi:ribonucleoside-diphosphate reductase beta chain
MSFALMEQAVDCETRFAEDLLSGVVVGLSVRDMRQYRQPDLHTLGRA